MKKMYFFLILVSLSICSFVFAEEEILNSVKYTIKNLSAINKDKNELGCSQNDFQSSSKWQKYYLTANDLAEDKFPFPNGNNENIVSQKAKEAAKNLPTDSDHFVYRGMAITPESLKTIVDGGLDPLLSSIKVLYFAEDAATAISFSRQVPSGNVKEFVNVVFQVDSQKLSLKKDGSYYVFEGPKKIPPEAIKAIYIFDKNFKNLKDSFVKLERD